MYAGRIVESGPVEQVLCRPCHPYTAALLRAVPRLRGSARDLVGIEGMVPRLSDLPPGCAFHPRCPLAVPVCRARAPDEEPTTAAARVRCHQWRHLADAREPAHA